MRKATSTCPSCQKALRVTDDMIGRRVRCPACQHRYVLASVSFSDADTELPSAVGTLSESERATGAVESGSIASGSPRSRTGRTSSGSSRGASEPAIGKLGRFELRAALGQGTFGRVYRAFDPLLGRLVALKVPRFGADETTKVKRFHTEARAAASLRHPNIVAVFESGECDGQLFLATEFVEGRTLSAAIADRRPTVRQAAAWTRDLALALAYAHEEGVVHRDIKPENIMFGANERLQIMDFGLAKRLDEDSSMTTDGSVMGTPAYMSPEQARGDTGQVGPASDQYSLGAILYELLTGRRPFSGPAHSVISQVISTDPPTPHSIDAKIPPDLAAVCTKAMEKQPSRRYPSLADMAADLDRWLMGKETIARPIGRLERAARWCRQNPVIAGLSAAAILLSVVAMGGWLRASLAISGEAEQRRRAQEALVRAEDARQVAEIDRQRAEKSFAAESEARRAAERSEKAADDSKRKALERLAESHFERGISLCELGDVSHGLLYMTLALKSLPPGGGGWGRAIRTNLSAWQGELCTLTHIFRHPRPIAVVAFSPDGKLLATASNDSTAQIWDVASKSATGAALKHPSGVTAVRFSHDGKRLYTGCRDGRVRVWDVGTRTALGREFVHPQAVTSLALSPDSTALATGCGDMRMRFWNAASGAPIGKPLGESVEPPLRTPIHSVVFSPDGKLAASAGRAGQLWNVADQQAIGGPLRHRYQTWVVDFFEDGKSIVTGSSDHAARRWSVPDGAPVGEPFELEGTCEAAATHGARYAVGGDVGIVHVVDGKSLASPPQRLEHGAGVKSLSWSPDGRMLAAGCNDGTARLWNVPTPRADLQGSTLTHPLAGEVLALAISPNGNQILTGMDTGSVDLWDVKTGAWVRNVGRHQDRNNKKLVYNVQFHPNGRLLATASIDGTVRFWDLETRQPHGEPVRFPASVNSICFARKGDVVVACSEDGSLGRIDVQTAMIVGKPMSLGAGLTGAILSPDERLVAAGFASGTVRLIDAGTGTDRLAKPIQHGAHVWSLLFSPDGDVLLTVGADGRVRFWNATTGELDRRPALLHRGQVHRAGFSRDGSLIVTVGSDHTARFWDAATGAPVGPSMPHHGAVYTFAFHPDGDRLFTAGMSVDDAARAWPVPRPMRGPARQVQSRIEALTGLALHEDNSMTPLRFRQWNVRSAAARSR